MRPIQFGVIYSFPVPSVKLISFSNWRTARPLQLDVMYSSPVPSVKLTSFFELADGASHTVSCEIFYSCS